MAPPPITIVVVQDKAVVRAGLTALIATCKDLKLVGEASNSAEAVQVVGKLHPKVVLMDLRSISSADFDAPKAVRETAPGCKIVVLTDNEEAGVFAALALEADGYCLKESEFDRIHSAIRTVAAGEFWLDSAIAKKVVKALVDTIAILGSEPGNKQSGFEDDALSPREVEVLSLVSQGLSNLKIAEELSISAETVKSHIRHIMKKLVVSDRTQAAVKALKKGLI